MNKNDLRVIKTKQNIHKSLLQILKVKPLSQIKVTELCKKAAINRGTFYFHYEEVGAVFTELFQEIMVDLRESYNEPYNQGFRETFETLDPQMIAIFHHVKKYEDFYKIVLSPDVAMQYYYMLFDELNKLMQEGTINSDHYGVAFSSNAIIGIIIEWCRQDFKASVQEMNEKLVGIIKRKMPV